MTRTDSEDMDRLTSILIEDATIASLLRLEHYLDIHQGHEHVSYVDHIRMRRREKTIQAQAFKLIYLDTNAWKCAADRRQGKELKTPEMERFADVLERAASSGEFAFLIGAPNFFELDSMNDASTRNSLCELVDQLSKGFCTLPYSDRMGTEIVHLEKNEQDHVLEIEDFLCSPAELLGIPNVELREPLIGLVDEGTLNKAYYDAVSELPFSFQLQLAGNAPGEKWRNSNGIEELNTNKALHQPEIANLISGIFVELKGCIEAWCRENSLTADPAMVVILAGRAIIHWNQYKSSTNLSTLKIISGLHGLMRFDSHRKYKSGDIADYMIAASALPVASAFFTDRKLVNYISDPRIRLDGIFSCDLVSGFGEMGDYLEVRMAT